MNELLPCMDSEFRTWEEGFDACTHSERSGKPATNLYSGKQGMLWQQGYTMSQRVTEIGKQAA